MSMILSGIKSLFSSSGESFAGKLVDTVKDYFPPSMSEQEKANLQIAITDAVHQKEVELIELAHKDQIIHIDQMKSMEGTATDLLQAGWLGRIMLFLRGSQRVVWGIGTFVFDIFWFFTDKIPLPLTVKMSDPDNSAVTIMVADPVTTGKITIIVTVHMLVLSFLYGERAIKNLTPMIVMLVGMFTGRNNVVSNPFEDPKKDYVETRKALDLSKSNKGRG